MNCNLGQQASAAAEECVAVGTDSTAALTCDEHSLGLPSHSLDRTDKVSAQDRTGPDRLTDLTCVVTVMCSLLSISSVVVPAHYRLRCLQRSPTPLHPLLSFPSHSQSTSQVAEVLSRSSLSSMSLCTLATRCLHRTVRASSLTSNPRATLTLPFSSTPRTFTSSAHASSSHDASQLLSPAVMFLVRSEGLDPASIRGTGKDGRLLKFDVVQAIKAGTAKKLSPSASSSASAAPAAPKPTLKRQEGPRFTAGGRRNRSAMFEPLPKPTMPPAATTTAAATKPTKLQAIDKPATKAAQPAAATKQQQVAPPVLRRQEGPRYTASGRRNRSAMFHSP